MNETFGKRYLAELEQLLQAESQLRGQGTELLDDPEYRALRERFIEGELTLAQLSERVDNLAMTRGDEDVDLTPARNPSDDGDDEIDDPDDLDGLDIFDDSHAEGGPGTHGDGSGGNGGSGGPGNPGGGGPGEGGTGDGGD